MTTTHTKNASLPVSSSAVRVFVKSALLDTMNLIHSAAESYTRETMKLRKVWERLELRHKPGLRKRIGQCSLKQQGRQFVAPSSIDQRSWLSVMTIVNFNWAICVWTSRGGKREDMGGGDYHCSKPWGDKGEEVYLKQAVFFVFVCFFPV